MLNIINKIKVFIAHLISIVVDSVKEVYQEFGIVGACAQVIWLTIWLSVVVVASPVIIVLFYIVKLLVKGVRYESITA